MSPSLSGCLLLPYPHSLFSLLLPPPHSLFSLLLPQPPLLPVLPPPSPPPLTHSPGSPTYSPVFPPPRPQVCGGCKLSTCYLTSKHMPLALLTSRTAWAARRWGRWAYQSRTMLCMKTPRLEQLLTSFTSNNALVSSLISWQLLQATVKQDESKLSLQVTFCLKGVRYFCLQEAHNDTPASRLLASFPGSCAVPTHKPGNEATRLHTFYLCYHFPQGQNQSAHISRGMQRRIVCASLPCSQTTW